MIYIKEGRLPDSDRMYGDETSPATSINSRIHTGTAHFATYLTVPAALDFHAAVGPAYKAARVRYLRDRWVSGLAGGDCVRVTPALYNAPADADRLAAGLKEIAGRA